MADDLSARLAAVSGGNAPAPAGQPAQQDDLTARLQQVSGTAPVSMTGPNGEQVQVPQNQVDDMRSKNYAVNSSKDTQLMITPDGKLTNALPDEVDKFKASGHVLVKPDGTFTVDPLPGEDNTDTMARAAKIGKAVTPAMIAAEKAKMTPARIATTLVAAPAIGVGTAAGIAGLGEGIAAAPEAVQAGLRYLGRGALPGMQEQLGKQVLIQGAKSLGKKFLIGEGASRIFTHKSLLSNIMELF